MAIHEIDFMDHEQKMLFILMDEISTLCNEEIELLQRLSQIRQERDEKEKALRDMRNFYDVKKNIK